MQGKSHVSAINDAPPLSSDNHSMLQSYGCWTGKMSAMYSQASALQKNDDLSPNIRWGSRIEAQAQMCAKKKEDWVILENTARSYII